MKKIFSLFAAVLLAGGMMADNYVKVTAAPTDWSGDYLIVYEAGGVAFDGSLATLDAVSNTVAVTISEGAIAATDALNAAKFTIAKVTGGYSLQSASGKFIGITSNSNGLKQADEVGDYTHDLSLDESGNAVIKANFAESTMTLRYNKASNQTRFRYYKSGQEAIALYKFVAAGGGTPQEDTWTVAGSSAVAFGTTWDPTNTANDMVKQNDGTFKWEKENLELAAGTIQFKVAKNHSWDEAYPSQDYNLAIDAAGLYTITITFEPDNSNNVSAIATKTGEAVVVPTVIMHGTFTGSWADTEAFAKAEDKKTASLKLTLAAGDIEFGLKLDGAWKANGATITRENASTSLASGEGNMHLTADVAGDYTFTYTYETQTLTVTFPALPISLTEFITNKPAEAVTLKDLTVIFATGKNTYVIDEDGVALVIYDANKTYYDGTLAAGKVLSGQKATYTSYKNQDEIIPANAANVSDGTAPEAELRTEAPTVADINKFIAFNNVAAEKASNNNYYIFDGAVQLYFASSSDKPSEDGNYDVEGVFINYNSTQLELIVTAIEKSKGTAIDNATVATKAQKMIIDGQLFIIRDGIMFNANGAAVK